MGTHIGAEKRRLQRMPGSFGDIALQVGADTAIQKASVRDYSIQGMAVLVDQTVSPGQQVIIHMLHRYSTVKIDAEVRHATALDNGEWLLGCQLSRFLSVADLMGP